MTAAYQQFETMERCTACGGGILPAEQPRVCPNCQTVFVCPRIEEWPDKMIAFLCRRLVKQWLAPFESMTKQHRFEALLRTVFRGTAVNRHMIPRAATSNEIWPLAMMEYEKWLRTAAGATSEDLSA